MEKKGVYLAYSSMSQSTTEKSQRQGLEVADHITSTQEQRDECTQCLVLLGILGCCWYMGAGEVLEINSQDCHLYLVFLGSYEQRKKLNTRQDELKVLL